MQAAPWRYRLPLVAGSDEDDARIDHADVGSMSGSALRCEAVAVAVTLVDSWSVLDRQWLEDRQIHLAVERHRRGASCL